MIQLLNDAYPQITKRCNELEAIIKEAERNGTTTKDIGNNCRLYMPIKDGKKDGPACICRLNGTIECSWSYVDDERSGVFTIFYENGCKRYQSLFKHGRECENVTFWEHTDCLNIVPSFVKIFVKYGLADGVYIDRNLLEDTVTIAKFDSGLLIGKPLTFDLDDFLDFTVKGPYSDTDNKPTGPVKPETQDDDKIEKELSEFNKVYNDRKLDGPCQFKNLDMETNDALKSFGDLGSYYITKVNFNPCKLETYPNGDKSMCYQHKNNIKDGLYERWWENGQMKVTAIYKNGKLDGLYERFYDNGQIEYRENWKDGKRDGLYERWWENGQMKVRVPYKNGKRDGLHEAWYENGQIECRSNYKNGKLDGLCECWHDNGQLKSRLVYKNGKRDGLCEWWYENEQLEHRSNYKNGKEDDVSKYWYKNGQLAYKVNYKDGKKDGLLEKWCSNGNLYYKENYKDGKKDGLSERWYESGQKDYICSYKNGVIDGLHEAWLENGDLLGKCNFKNGKRIGLIEGCIECFVEFK